MRSKKFEIVSYKGESVDAPENTMASVDLAWKRDLGAVSVDVRRASCGTLIAFCDDNTMRVAKKNKKIFHQTYDELSDLDAGKHKGKEWRGEKIPMLSEILKTVPHKKHIYLDIKTGPKVIRDLEREIRLAELKPNQVFFMADDIKTASALKSAFRHSVVLFTIRMHPEIKTNEWKPDGDSLVAKVRRENLDGVCIAMCDGITAELIERITIGKIYSFVSEVTNVEDAKKLREFGVDGIFTTTADLINSEM